jgi:transposase
LITNNLTLYHCSNNLIMPKKLSQDKYNEIVVSLKSGLSIKSVALKCGVGKSTVSQIRTKELPDTPTLSPGRLAKLSPQCKRLCVRSIALGEAKTAKEVQKQLEKDLNIVVSANTVCNTLKEAGLGAVKRPTKPMLSSKNIKARLQFAQKHQYWTVDDWKRIIWSDETKINRYSSDGCNWAWKFSGTSLQPHQVNQVVKHGGGNIKVWGCMTYYGVGYMCQIHQNLTKDLGWEVSAVVKY